MQATLYYDNEVFDDFPTISDYLQNLFKGHANASKRCPKISNEYISLELQQI